MKKTLVVCENCFCGKSFWKRNGELNRSKKLGRKNYCSLKCYGVAEATSHFKFVSPENKEKNQNRIKEFCGNNRDELTQFRFYTHVVRNRQKDVRFENSNIDEKYLKDLWDQQNGICPFTGWHLVLPDNVGGWKTYRNGKRASLDRINNSKGYEKGNVRFISFMANVARNNMDDEELIRFCKAVVEYRKE